MNSPVDVAIQFAIPFDHNIFVEREVLGLRIDIEVAGVPAKLEFPSEQSGQRALAAPTSTVRSVDKHLPDEIWGIKRDIEYIELTSALISVPAQTRLDFDLNADQVSGYQGIVENVSDWWESFCRWLWSITAQSLNPVDPDPKVIHRRSKNVITMVGCGENSSIPAVASPMITVLISGTGVSAERLINARVLQKAINHIGSEVPLYLELFASARMAARRGDSRRSIIDASSACETVLSSLLSLPAGHKLTLGGLVSQAIDQGYTLPSDTKPALVDLRNDAVHRGIVPRNADVNRVLEISEELITMWDSQHIQSSSLKPFNRPQRHDLVLIRA
jgi:hypothetical protein